MITQLGRFSLTSILKNLGQFNKLWIPDITCAEVLDHLSNENIECQFYKTELGKPNLNLLKRFHNQNNDIILIVHHFGEIKKYEFLENHFKGIIYDYTQIILTPKELLSIPPNSFSAYRKYTRFYYGSFYKNNFDSKKSSLDIKISIKNIIKHLILGISPIKFIYNRNQGSTSSSSQLKSMVKYKEIKLSWIELLLFKHLVWKIKLYSKVVNNELEILNIKILNKSKYSFFALVSSDISNSKISKLNNLGFNIYNWPDVSLKSPEAAHNFNKSHYFINYDIPFWSYLWLKIIRF